MELTESVKQYLIETAERLKGSERRFFMARTVKELGIGGQRRVEKELGWERKTINRISFAIIAKRFWWAI